MFLIPATAFLLPFLASASVEPLVESCGGICSDLKYQTGELALCSTKNSADIWNTTSAECQLHIGADLRSKIQDLNRDPRHELVEGSLLRMSRVLP